MQDSRGWPLFLSLWALHHGHLPTGIRAEPKFSAEDILKLTKNIYRVDNGDKQGFKVSAIQKKTKNVLDKLGVDLLRKI